MSVILQHISTGKSSSTENVREWTVWHATTWYVHTFTITERVGYQWMCAQYSTKQVYLCIIYT